MKTRKTNARTVIALVLCVIMLFAFCACGSKGKISKQDFKAKAEEMGLVSAIVIPPFGVDETAIIGKAENGKLAWQAEYYKFSSSEQARASFDENKTIFEAVSGTETSVILGDRATYEKTGEGHYMYLSQIEDTLVYINVDEQYKADAKAFIAAIGY